MPVMNFRVYVSRARTAMEGGKEEQQEEGGREREREKGRERESVENQTTWSTPAPRFTPSPLLLPSLPFASHPSLVRFPSTKSLFSVHLLCAQPFMLR